MGGEPQARVTKFLVGGDGEPKAIRMTMDYPRSWSWSWSSTGGGGALVRVVN